MTRERPRALPVPAAALELEQIVREIEHVYDLGRPALAHPALHERCVLERSVSRHARVQHPCLSAEMLRELCGEGLLLLDA